MTAIVSPNQGKPVRGRRGGARHVPRDDVGVNVHWQQRVGQPHERSLGDLRCRRVRRRSRRQSAAPLDAARFGHWLRSSGVYGVRRLAPPRHSARGVGWRGVGGLVRKCGEAGSAANAESWPAWGEAGHTDTRASVARLLLADPDVRRGRDGGRRCGPHLTWSSRPGLALDSPGGPDGRGAADHLGVCARRAPTATSGTVATYRSSAASSIDGTAGF